VQAGKGREQQGSKDERTEETIHGRSERGSSQQPGIGGFLIGFFKRLARRWFKDGKTRRLKAPSPLLLYE
jgi:hypothetical protein